jgi:hypothetical protein
VKGLIALLERRRTSLTDEAFVLGRRLYTDAPASFTSRIEGYWNAWERGQPSSTACRGRSFVTRSAELRQARDGSLKDA